jgi:hypothetical protein
MVDIFTIALAVVILVAVARWKRPVRPITAFILALLTAAWIWANLHDFGWKEEWGNDVPDGLNPVTEAMFYRGWPVAPFMLCLIERNRFQASGLEEMVLVFDWLVLFLALCLARLVCERCSRAVDSLRSRERFREE